jgi:hypothetical protein
MTENFNYNRPFLTDFTHVILGECSRWQKIVDLFKRKLRTEELMKPEIVIEQAQAQWMGRMDTTKGKLVMFRDPLTGSSCALPEEGLTVASVLAKLESKRREFGK